MDLPFEAHPPVPMLDTGDTQLSAGVVVMAAHVDLPGLGRLPALVFRFAKADGTGFYPPLMLVNDAETLAKLTPLVAAAVDTARKAAS